MNRHERRRRGAGRARKETTAKPTRGLALRQASAHREAGRLREAAAIYRSLLRSRPDDAEALHGLGSTHAAAGDIAGACDLLARSVECGPASADALSDLGVLRRRLGDREGALEAYRAALAIEPRHADALFNCANLLRAAGEADEAAALYRRALAAQPGHAGALNNLGLLLHDKGDYAGAAERFRQALASDDSQPLPHNNLGNALMKTGAVEDAAACYRRAVALDGAYRDGWRNLSVALQELDRPDEALGPAQRAAGLDPENAELQLNLGTLLFKLGRTADAAAALERAVALRPDYPEARWNRAQSLLLAGNFRDGWAEYEWRLRCPGLNAYGRSFEVPRWDGGALDGRRILVHAEQGFGDTLQFVRFLPLVKARGGHVILECQPALTRLLEGVAGADEVVPAGRKLPAFDCTVPLLSLPYLFGIDEAAIPAAPYLRAPAPPLLELPAGENRRIGLVWAGRPSHANDRNRSIPLERFRPLLGVAGCDFFSLQLGPAREQIAAGGMTGRIADLADALSDFAATAAAVAQLDLVIAVDTAVAHLAGALGRPVWLLLPYVPDWRWMLNRADSPWYPAMRLFRQPAPGDWGGVFGEVGAALDASLSDRGVGG